MAEAAGWQFPPGTRLADVGEDELLAAMLPLLAGTPSSPGVAGRAGSQGGSGAAGVGVLVGPGDDAALVSAPGGSVLATTDALVRGRDWRDDWSGGVDVGAKAVAQNVADIAAMGGTPTGLLVTLAADPQTPLAWVRDLTAGLAEAAADAGAPVVGGDLSSATEGVVVVSVVALGALGGRAPVRRGGARAGDQVAVAGSLGRSAAGLLLLQQGREVERPDLVGYHRRPRPPYEQGPVAARAGATAMIDISDGLARDGGRIAAASGVRLELEGAELRDYAAALRPALDGEQALGCVLSGGEEHSLLACFAGSAPLPPGWVRIGRVEAAMAGGPALTVDGQVPRDLGWDHFGG